MLSRSARTTAAAAVLAVASAGVLSGCGGDDAKAGGSPTAASSSSTASTASSSAAPATSSAPSSSALGPGLPGVPANARANTTDAAIAFTKHYIQKMVQVGAKPQKGVIEPYGLAGCKACDGYSDYIGRLIQDRQHESGAVITIVDGERITGEKGVVVRTTFDQSTYRIVGSDGSAVRTVQKQRFGVVYFLRWTAGGWRVAESKSTSS
ncbi:hypothetical protein [Luteipulveratus flavus]|uniref:Lipoprotein n=1 Tax=Luteipulveratus flavus TaxID=3031728 RepID=A0ABT6CA36_9MICO|nr:hypothetical protein [Luteipulveratus sp. YIM 133296]MDF8265182.1 hypothetical protein [Luteipulveratus sp. YIM 133296]